MRESNASISDFESFLAKPIQKPSVRRVVVHMRQKQSAKDQKIQTQSPEIINPVFDGIFRYLWLINNQNPHDAGLIEVTCSDWRFNPPQNILNPTWKSYFYTTDEPNSFLKFDFKTYRVKLSSYAIQTNATGTGGWHMQSWILECSTNDKDYTILDEYRGTELLNGKSKFSNFTLYQCPWFRFLKLTMTEKNHWGDYSLLLSHLELHGEIHDQIHNLKVTR